MSFLNLIPTKRSFAAALTILMAVLTGCGSSAEVETRAETSQDVTLNVITMFGEPDGNAAVYENIMWEFQENHPGVTIEDESSVSDERWKNSVAARFSAGNEPDVLQFFTDATADTLISMDKFVSVSEIRQEYPEYAGNISLKALTQVTNSDGILRAVPTTGFWEGLYCNTDLFEKLDLPLPTDYESFAHAVEVFRENDIIPVACAVESVPHYWLEYALLYGAGKENYESKWSEENLTSFEKGLSFFHTLNEIGAFPDNADSITNGQAQDLFVTKKAAMILEGSWFYSVIKDLNTTTVVPFPGIPDQKEETKVMVGGMTSGFYISRRAWENPAKRNLAVEFVMANTSQDAIQRYWDRSGGVSTPASQVSERSTMTSLAVAASDYIEGMDDITLSTDSRMNPAAYQHLIAGVVDVYHGADAGALLKETLSIEQKAREKK